MISLQNDGENISPSLCVNHYIHINDKNDSIIIYKLNKLFKKSFK